jgi:hypothetical protein
VVSATSAKTAVPKYRIPSRRHLAESVLPDLHAAVKQSATEEINKEATIISIDIWTSKTTQSSIGITVHFIADTLVRRQIVLSIQHMSTKHTAFHIVGMMQSIFTEWEIPMEKIGLVLRDGGSNIVKAC